MYKYIKSIIISILFLPLLASANDLRIVSVGGGATETIFALGGQKNVVGVDISSTWPAQVKELPQVGYQRTLAAEGILSLKPDILIVTSAAGPEPVLKQIEKAGVDVVRLPSAPTIETVKLRINEIAAILGNPEKAPPLWNKVQTDLNLAKEKQAKIKTPKKVLFLLAVPGRPPMTAGKNTEADAMITLAGAQNVVTEFESYRVLTPEAIQALNPDVILTTDDGLAAMGGVDALWRMPGLQKTNAAKERNLIAMDLGFLLNFGPRTGEAALALTDKLYGGDNAH